MGNWRAIAVSAFSLALLCTSVQADAPYPLVSYSCLSSEDRLIISAGMSYGIDNTPDLYEPRSIEKDCKLSSGIYKTAMKYSQVTKCGVMSVEITVLRNSAVLVRREVGIGVCYGATDIEGMKFEITVNGKSGEVAVQ